MIRCKHVADALADTNIHDMTPLNRLAAKLHIFLCPCCGQSHREVILFQDAAHEYNEGEHLPAAELSETSRSRLRDLICCAQHEDESSSESPGGTPS